MWILLLDDGYDFFRSLKVCFAFELLFYMQMSTDMCEKYGAEEGFYRGEDRILNIE